MLLSLVDTSGGRGDDVGLVNLEACVHNKMKDAKQLQVDCGVWGSLVEPHAKLDLLHRKCGTPLRIPPRMLLIQPPVARVRTNCYDFRPGRFEVRSCYLNPRHLGYQTLSLAVDLIIGSGLSFEHK